MKIVARRIRTSQYLINRGAVATIALATCLLCCGAKARANGFTPYQLLNTTGQTYYENAFTLIDLPWEALVQAIPELRRVVPAPSQQRLPFILSKAGARVEADSQKFTEIVAEEQVTQEQCGPAGHRKKSAPREFNYMIIARHQAGQERITEFRSDANGRPVEFLRAAGLSSEGYATMWAILFPGNQSGSNFRYLGQQLLGGRPVSVIGFAQRPGWSAVVGHVTAGGRRVLILHQGVMWIDSTTNQILKIRTDLLKPRLDAQLELLTAEIQFGEVHILDAASTALWVPLRVSVTTVLNGQVFREMHLYSNYQLPSVNLKIKPAPAETATPPKTN